MKRPYLVMMIPATLICSSLFRCSAFVVVPSRTLRTNVDSCRRMVTASSSSSSIEETIIENDDKNIDISFHHDDIMAAPPSPSTSFNPLGPPTLLASLKVGESFQIPSLLDTSLPSTTFMTIKRLSQSPDIFRIRNFTYKEQCQTLIQTAKSQGMKVAGTRNSHDNQIRKHSYLTWIEQTQDDGDDTAIQIAQTMGELAKLLFVHESISFQGDDQQYCMTEDLQVAKYDPQGSFDYHHDGYQRFVTVLTYLNGVGGTYFPLANSHHNDNDDDGYGYDFVYKFS